MFVKVVTQTVHNQNSILRVKLIFKAKIMQKEMSNTLRVLFCRPTNTYRFVQSIQNSISFFVIEELSDCD